MLYLGADHRGFKKKEELKKYLREMGVKFLDLGNTIFDPNDDYPDFAKRVAEKVSKDPKSKGILICGSGIGMSISANKFKRVRAGLCLNEKMARLSKEDTNCNILCLSADFLSLDKMKKIVKVWLRAKFSQRRRQKRRIKKISLYENENIKI